MSNGKIAWLDLETSGLDPVKNGIVQAAFIIDIEGKVLGERRFRMNPVGKELDPKALEVHGIPAEIIATYQPATDAKEDIAAFLDNYVSKYDKADKLTIAGFNVDFDISFLEALWIETGDKYFYSYFNHATIDPFRVQPFLEWAGLSATPEKRNLGTLAAQYGVKLEGAHDALFDIRATRELALAMRDLVRKGMRT
jgi:DNA polymerase-3 subunit epsilon